MSNQWNKNIMFMMKIGNMNINRIKFVTFSVILSCELSFHKCFFCNKSCNTSSNNYHSIHKHTNRCTFVFLQINKLEYFWNRCKNDRIVKAIELSIKCIFYLQLVVISNKNFCKKLSWGSAQLLHFQQWK